MSRISEIFEQVDTKLSSTFSTHKKMVNPYNLELNDEFILNAGYGFYLGPAFNTNRLTGCQLSLERTLVVPLTRINRGTDRDISIRETAEKALLEDHFNLVQAIESDPVLESKTAKLLYQSDAGIEFVFIDKINFISIVSSFTFEYFENLS